MISNLVILIGNAGQNPETKLLQGGKSVSNFSLATQEGKDITAWHKIEAWDKVSDLVSKYVQKGSKLAVQGRIKYDSFEDKDGVKRTITKIVIYDLTLLSPSSHTETVSAEDGSNSLPF